MCWYTVHLPVLCQEDDPPPPFEVLAPMFEGEDKQAPPFDTVPSAQAPADSRVTTPARPSPGGLPLSPVTHAHTPTPLCPICVCVSVVLCCVGPAELEFLSAWGSCTCVLHARLCFVLACTHELRTVAQTRGCMFDTRLSRSCIELYCVLPSPCARPPPPYRATRTCTRAWRLASKPTRSHTHIHTYLHTHTKAHTHARRYTPCVSSRASYTP